MNKHMYLTKKYWYFLATALVIIDQLSKYLVSSTMDIGDKIPVNAIFNLVHYQNKGAAFSFLATAGGWQRYLFICFAIGVSIWLIIAIYRSSSKLETLAYALVLGGAIGNLSDRLFRGAVVDYLDFYWGTHHWPAFNIADIVIVVGASAMFLTMAKDRNTPSKDG